MAAAENFRENVARELDRRQISLRAFAKSLKTSHPYIWKIIHGEVIPSLDRCEAIADALQLPLTTLLKTPRHEN